MKLFRYFCFTFSLVASTLFGVNNFSVKEVKTNIDTSLTNSEQSTAKEQASGITTDFNVILLPLNANGDVTIIDYGDCEILIDAGGGANSGGIIYDALNTYVDDGKIELIIITHSDSDHLISFSENPDLHLRQIHIFQIKPCQFRQTDSGLIEHGQNQAITHAVKILSKILFLKQALHLSLPYKIR